VLTNYNTTFCKGEKVVIKVLGKKFRRKKGRKVKGETLGMKGEKHGRDR
jgi:hypothetical protein